MVLVCGDTLPQHKPDPAPARHACRLLDVATSDALFVGDSVTDVETARAAGCPIVCVRDGYNHGTPATQLGADAVIDSLIQLL
jgi:phosphoglycolate phosphatase